MKVSVFVFGFILTAICINTTSGQATYPTYFTKISRTTGGLTSPVDNDAQFGIESGAIGDLDDDGVIDVAIGATNQRGSLVGSVFILFMNTNGTVKKSVEILNPEPASERDSFGSSISALGDLDGDGIEDIGVGAGYDSDNGFQAGAIWIVFLKKDGSVKALQKISALAGNFTAPLVAGNVFGTGSAAIGDLDGDGVMDMAVGSRIPGSVYILFLKPNGTVKGYNKITNGTAGLSIDSSDLFGYQIASLGDVDGDGVTDIAVGGHRTDVNFVDSGVVYVIFLTTAGTVKSFTKISSGLANFNDTNARILGVGVAGIGDYNKDGVRDMVVGGNDGNSGAIWYMMLNANGTVKSYYKISSNSNNSNLALNSGDFFGGSVAFLGDLNSDGIDDILVGAFQDDDGGINSGAIWISNVCPGLLVNAGSDINICSAQPLFMNATLPPGGTGTWSVAAGDGQFSDGHNKISLVSKPQLGINKYVWTVTTSPGCTGKDTVKVTVDPVVKAMAGNDKSYCTAPGLLVTLSGNTPPQGIGIWKLLKGSGTISSINSPVTTVTNVSLGQNLFVWEFPATAYCPLRKDTVAVTIVDKPVATINLPDSIFTCDNQTLLQADKQTLGTGMWKISAGNATLENPDNASSLIFFTEKNKPVNVEWLVTLEGCPSASDYVTILPYNVNDLPNVITPNRDGKNEAFKIPNIAHIRHELKIYNRWGDQVFSTSEYNNNWTGGGLAAGVYFYSLELKDCLTFVKGSISILY